MNREIKFKFWNNENKEFTYFSPSAKNKIHTIQDLYTDYIGVDNSNNIIPIQYTGIKDINENEIYEGDIIIPVKFKDIPNVIEYVQHGFYRVKKHGEKVYCNMLGNCKVKIIGNIFENPELLNN